MLTAAGLRFDVVPAGIDEASIRSTIESETACAEPSDVASILASEKALFVSAQNPGAFVVGSDQVLALGSRMLSKSTTLDEARETLDRLRGRSHELVSAVALARDGEVLWTAVDSAEMAMRPFSDEFLGSYLAHAGSSVLGSVGCYELEGLGVQLFERIDGDYFTILGMPLLPLLAELRTRGVISV